LLVFIKYVKMQ